MGKIDTAIISCPSGRGERDGGRKEGREGEGRKERFDEKIAPPFVRPSVLASRCRCADANWGVDGGGRKRKHTLAAAAAEATAQLQPELTYGGREGQPRRIGRLISGAKMRRESQGESGDITRAGRSKCGGDNRGRNYRAYRASGHPCAHSPLHNPSQRSPTNAAMPCTAHGGGGCDQVCGTINAARASFGGFGHLRERNRGGKEREMVSRQEGRDIDSDAAGAQTTRGDAGDRCSRRRCAATTTRRARAATTTTHVRQRSIGNRWELPLLRPSLSVHPSTYLRTMLCPLLSAASSLLQLVLRQRQGGQSGLFQGPLTRHKIVVESPHDLAVPYLGIHTRGMALASVRDGQMKPSDRSGN